MSHWSTVWELLHRETQQSGSSMFFLPFLMALLIIIFLLHAPAAASSSPFFPTNFLLYHYLHSFSPSSLITYSFSLFLSTPQLFFSLSIYFSTIHFYRHSSVEVSLIFLSSYFWSFSPPSASISMVIKYFFKKTRRNSENTRGNPSQQYFPASEQTRWPGNVLHTRESKQEMFGANA